MGRMEQIEHITKIYKHNIKKAVEVAINNFGNNSFLKMTASSFSNEPEYQQVKGYY